MLVVSLISFQSKKRDFRMFGGLGGPWGGQPPPPLIPPPPQHHFATAPFSQPPPWPHLTSPPPPPMAPQHPPAPLTLPLLPAPLPPPAAAPIPHPTPTPLPPPSPVAVLPPPRQVQSTDVLQAALDTVAQAQGHIANLRHQLAPLQPTSRFTIQRKVLCPHLLRFFERCEEKKPCNSTDQLKIWESSS